MMTAPFTLLAAAGADLTPASLSASVLILVDCQNEYVTGRLRCDGVDEALGDIARLLLRARALHTPVVHIVHQGRRGDLFDPASDNGQIHPLAAPVSGEPVLAKTLPNAFAGTQLQQLVQETGRHNLILAGFQTHMCISATVRAALDLGFRSTVVASGCASRDLPAVGGGIMPAGQLHQATLAALADRFAVIAATPEMIGD